MVKVVVQVELHRQIQHSNMSWFGLGKPKHDTQVDWLNKVDSAYQRAFQIKNATGLAEYLTRPCMSIIMEQIRFGEKAYSGLTRYQHVNWIKGVQDATGVKWRKEVTYDQIQMSHGVIVPVGDNTTEEWTIVLHDGINRVSEIRRV